MKLYYERHLWRWGLRSSRLVCAALFCVFVCLGCLTKAPVSQDEQCLVNADSNQRFSHKILNTIQLSGYYWLRKTALPKNTDVDTRQRSFPSGLMWMSSDVNMKRTDACLFLSLPVQSMSQPKETVFYSCEPCVPETPLWGFWRLIRPQIYAVNF